MLAAHKFYSFDASMHELGEVETKMSMSGHRPNISSGCFYCENCKRFHLFILTTFVISWVLKRRILKLIVNNEMQRMWKETLAASFHLLYRRLLGWCRITLNI
jgi:hypothetical protein